MSPASAGVPTVVIHPPEEDLEALQGQEQKTEENVDVTAGNYPKSSRVVLSASGPLALGMPLSTDRKSVV